MSQYNLYKTRQWQLLRRSHLAANPLCKFCLEMRKRTAATVVDHIAPHRGDVHKFYDASNLQSLCKPCHDRHKQRLERSGVLTGHKLTGEPIDPGHHWLL